MRRNIIPLLTAALVLIGIACHAATVTDNNGLIMTIDPNGSVTNLVCNGRSVLDTSVFSGFTLQDMNSGGSQNITGSITSGTDSITVTGQTNNGLKLVATISSSSGCIKIHTKVQDLNLAERAVQASFALCLNSGTWNWHEDVNNTYSDGNFHFQSNFPFAAVSDSSNRGLALAWPMTNPRNFGLYVAPSSNNSFVASLGLGLSSSTTKFPNYAEYDFVLYSFDGSDKFRGAAGKYYAIYPDSFVSRAPKQGMWALWVGSGVEDYATRMGVAYNEAEFDFTGWTTVQRDNAFGFLSMQYSEPWGSYYPLPIGFNTAHPGAYTPQSAQFNEISLDKAALLAQVSSDLSDYRTADRYPGMRRYKVAQAIINSAVEGDSQGNWLMYNYSPKGFVWGSGNRIGWDNVQFILNPDPELPQPNRADIEWDGQIMYVQNKAAALVPSASLGGIYIDSCVNSTGWDRFNFRRDHWAYADYPLGYTKVGTTYVPAQALNLCFAEHFKWLHNQGASRNWPVLANSWQPIWPFMAAYVDILGVGEHSGATPVDENCFATARALAYHKPVSVMDYALSLYGYPVDANLVQTMVEPKINHYLMYGIFPGTANSFYNADDRLLKLQLVAPVFEQYKPIFEAITSAGWEPTRAATISDSSVLLERWGDNTQKGLYYTLHNSSTAAKTVTVTVTTSSIQGGVPTLAKELVTGQSVTLSSSSTTFSFTITLSPGRTAAVRLLNPAIGSINSAKENDGVWASLDFVVVTASFSGYFYVENVDRSGGIRVVKNNHGMQIGQMVNLVGRIATSADHERYIDNPEITSAVGA